MKALPRQPFLKDQGSYDAFDPVAGHVHQPHARLEFDWKEHDKGVIVMTTNNLGLRNDRDTASAADENRMRVLITGDSHTDGVPYNAENVASRLETLLNTNVETRCFEALNGGAGYYTFQNYRGLLQKHLGLQPGAFIVIVYTGNDFLETVQYAHQQGRRAVPDRPPRYFKLLKRVAAAREWAGATHQAFNGTPGCRTGDRKEAHGNSLPPLATSEPAAATPAAGLAPSTGGFLRRRAPDSMLFRATTGSPRPSMSAGLP